MTIQDVNTIFSDVDQAEDPRIGALVLANSFGNSTARFGPGMSIRSR